jgi:hypothetical protein
MHRLYEGALLPLRSIPECDTVEISYMDTVHIHPQEAYYIPVTLQHHRVADNLSLREGVPRLMTIRYLKTTPTKKSEGILGYREFEEIEITRQKTLESEIYEVGPPFRIEEFYDGLLLYFRVTELFAGGEIGEYSFYSEKNELVACTNSVYRVYPDKGGVLEYVIYNESFIYRFEPAVVLEYPFSYKFWHSSGRLYFLAKAGGKVLEIECPNLQDEGIVVKSDTSKGPLEFGMDDFLANYRHIFVQGCRLTFSPSFYE